MHIPACPTTQTELLPFDQALAEALRPSPDYDAGRWLYVPNTYQEYRYILATRGERPLICVGVNPSTAAPGDLDNTLKSVERVALHNGYDSFIMFNVYPQRATRPQDLEAVLNPALHRNRAQDMMVADPDRAAAKGIAPPDRNDASGLRIKEHVFGCGGPIICVPVVEKTKEGILACVRDMVEAGRAWGARWYTAGARSKAGHPHHPLYLRKDSGLDAFDAEAYCRTLERCAAARRGG